MWLLDSRMYFKMYFTHQVKAAVTGVMWPLGGSRNNGLQVVAALMLTLAKLCQQIRFRNLIKQCDGISEGLISVSPEPQPQSNCLFIIKGEALRFWFRMSSGAGDSTKLYSYTRCCWARMTRCCPTSWTTPPSSTGSVCVERRGCATNTWTWGIWRTSSESLRCVDKKLLRTQKQTLLLWVFLHCLTVDGVCSGFSRLSLPGMC